MDSISLVASSERRPLLLDQLHAAEADHDESIRSVREGVRSNALAEDSRRWRALGAAIVGLARLIRRECAASAFCDARPSIAELAVRLVESVDDQIDAPAWRVIDAQVRLEAGSRP
jgi:hypothetical protein